MTRMVGGHSMRGINSQRDKKAFPFLDAACAKYRTHADYKVRRARVALGEVPAGLAEEGVLDAIHAWAMEHDRYPTMTELANKYDVDPNSLKYASRRLVAGGWIEPTRRVGGHSRELDLVPTISREKVGAQ